MNKELRAELDRCFYSDDYSEKRGITNADTESSRMLRELCALIGDEVFLKCEDSVMSACVGHEREGFLRGYEHCLTMLGLSWGGC